jgi:hypothetical protein
MNSSLGENMNKEKRTLVNNKKCGPGYFPIVS